MVSHECVIGAGLAGRERLDRPAVVSLSSSEFVCGQADGLPRFGRPPRAG